MSNVDSLSSFENIVIQVIGETSTKTSPEPRKFVQTFVLAKQPSGYFVLNDVWRYINDEEEEQPEQAVEETAQTDEQAAVAAEPAAAVQVAAEPTKVEQAKDAAVVTPSPGPEPELVDKKLEEVAKSEDTSAVDGKPKDASAEAAKDVAAESVPSEEGAAKDVGEESLKGPEKPLEPVHTPATASKSPAPAPPAEPEKPAKPMTWASRAAAAAAAAAGSRPAPALPKTATPPAPAQARAAAPAATPKPAPAAQRVESAPAAQEPAGAAASNEWQTAGGDSKRQNRPQSMVGQSDKEGTLGYVKYVTEKVRDDDLKAALTRYGQLTYFDINREKVGFTLCRTEASCIANLVARTVPSSSSPAQRATRLP